MDTFFAIDWESMFIPKVALLEIVFRGTLTYLFCFLYIRFFRRGAGQLGVTDLLLITLISDAAQNSMSGEYNSVTEGVVLVGTLIFWEYALDWLGFRTTLFKRFVNPDPVPLIKHGIPQRKQMDGQMISDEELTGILREKGVDDVSQVKLCQLESTGNISVIQKES